ncbi:MAG TPA: type II toxin-antitoxin system VapC family toxin [Stellaceae bacterium]|jgi:predicted nucleic acid-binding protein
MIFVDTNILIDVVENDPVWADWSRQQLVVAAGLGAVAINDVVYAELAIGYQEHEDLEAMIGRLRIVVVPLPRVALFLAGKAYQRYRSAGGIRTGVLPDFFLGAQALVAGAELITRDVRRYRTYFPGLALIAPTPN